MKQDELVICIDLVHQQDTICINFKQAVQGHVDKIEQGETQSSLGSVTSTSKVPINPTPPPTIHPSKIDELDQYEQEFIDDSELVLPGKSGYGFFAWKGSLVDFNPMTSTPILASITTTSLPLDLPTILSNPDLPSTQQVGLVQNNTTLPTPSAKLLKKKKKKSTSHRTVGTTVSTVGTTVSTVGTTVSTVGTTTPTTVPTTTPTLTQLLLPLPVSDAFTLLQSNALLADFTNKKIFPPQLKPLFNQCVITAMDHACLIPAFWDKMKSILPYNSFTLKKLASRQVFPDRIEECQKLLENAYIEFDTLVQQGMKEQNTDGSKFRFDDAIRVPFWTILCLEWELADMDNQIKLLAKEEPAFQEHLVRKAVYQKMATSWPEGSMETSLLSTQYSLWKKRRDKLADKNGFQGPEETEYGWIRADPYSKIVPRSKSKKKEVDGGGSEQILESSVELKTTSKPSTSKRKGSNQTIQEPKKPKVGK